MSDREKYTGSIAIVINDPPSTGADCRFCDDAARHYVRIGNVKFWSCHHHVERLLADPTEDEVKP